MAFVQRVGGNSFRVMTMDLAGGSVQAVSDTSDDESPSCAPGVARILFTSNRGNYRPNLWSMALNGTDLKQITNVALGCAAL